MKAISFKKIFKASLLPAALMLIAKIVGFWLTVMSLNIPWTINIDSDGFLGIYPLLMSNTVVQAASFMDMIFIWIMLLGLLYYLLIALFFHSTHLHPKIISKLVKFNLLYIVKNNFNLYHEIIVWLMFAWLANILVLINSVAGKTFIGIPTFSILFTAFLTVVFFKDACKELDKKEHERKI